MNIVYASEWDDIPINVNEFKEKENNKVLQQPEEIDYNVTYRKEIKREQSEHLISPDKLASDRRSGARMNEIEGECIKITPHDISYLPRKYWHLCNNSFLLHGYYNYKYLLLCEKKVDNERKYLVGVPGMFHQKEQTIAKMFGFTEFEGNGGTDTMKFGYWCTYL